MKKQIFLVSALVAIAMSSMFVACADKNAPTSVDGCSCSITDEYGDKQTIAYTKSEMEDYYDFKSCEKLAKALKEEGNERATCTGYSLNEDED